MSKLEFVTSGREHDPDTLLRTWDKADAVNDFLHNKVIQIEDLA